MEGAEDGAGGAAALDEVFGAAGDVEEHLRRFARDGVGLDLAAEGVERAERGDVGLDFGAREEAGDINAVETPKGGESIGIDGSVGQIKEKGLVCWGKCLEGRASGDGWVLLGHRADRTTQVPRVNRFVRFLIITGFASDIGHEEGQVAVLLRTRRASHRSTDGWAPQSGWGMGTRCGGADVAVRQFGEHARIAEGELGRTSLHEGTTAEYHGKCDGDRRRVARRLGRLATSAGDATARGDEHPLGRTAIPAGRVESPRRAVTRTHRAGGGFLRRHDPFTLPRTR